MDYKKNLANSSLWLRGVFMLIFGLIFYALCCVIGLLILFQFVTRLFTDSPNSHVLKTTQDLNNYALNILNYMTFQSEYRPFPFDSWAAENANHKKMPPNE